MIFIMIALYPLTIQARRVSLVVMEDRDMTTKQIAFAVGRWESAAHVERPPDWPPLSVVIHPDARCRRGAVKIPDRANGPFAVGRWESASHQLGE